MSSCFHCTFCTSLLVLVFVLERGVNALPRDSRIFFFVYLVISRVCCLHETFRRPSVVENSDSVKSERFLFV